MVGGEAKLEWDLNVVYSYTNDSKPNDDEYTESIQQSSNVNVDSKPKNSRALKELLDMEIISQEEFDFEKILNY